jgi:hypothetical protein
VNLSHVEFDVVWEELGLGDRPYPLTVPVFGETMGERAALREKVLRSLDERGEVPPRLEDQLVMLVRNRFTIDGQLSVGQHLRVLAAGRGEKGLLAVQTDAEVRLTSVRSSALVNAVVGLLPDEKPGPGTPVFLPSALFELALDAFAENGYLGFETTLRRGGINGRDLRGLSTLVESGRRGGGQLAANSVDRVGRRTRTPVLNWFDTDGGRYVMYAERRPDHEEWLTCAPGDSERIARRLTELVASVAV